MAQPAPDLVSRTFQDLKSKNEETRRKGAQDLRDLLITASRELPSEKFQEFSVTVNNRIAQLVVHSNDPTERIGGILALDKIIDVDKDDSGQKTTRFASYLRNVMKGNDTAAMILAARAMGNLAKPGGAVSAELVESEVKSSLEWLQSERQENRRFAAVLILKELARTSPTLLYTYVSQILELSWIALRDPKVLIRESAAEAVGVCFEIIAARDIQIRQQWFSRIYDEASQGLRIGTTEATHGSLLAIKELLVKGGMFMKERYRESCDIIYHLKDHKDPLIRRQVDFLIPILASYAPVEFTNLYLHKFINHLQGQLKKDKDKDRNLAFIAIGKVAGAVNSAIAPYLDNILVYIRESLGFKVRNKAVNERPVFECISMLSIAVGQTFSKYMDLLLDPIFACGLSEALTQALVDMAHYIDPVKPVIQEKLLDMLSMILCGRPFRPLGSPASSQPISTNFIKDMKDPQAQEAKESEIALALHTLGSFDFSGHVLNEFVRDVAIRYVDNDKPEIRKAAALTCCQLFVRDPIVKQTSIHSIQVVSQVIEKLLTVGVADADSEIRKIVLLSLDTRFDRHLAKAENVRSLFLALNDEVFAIREAAISIIGRLTHLNPAYVMPSLRKTLIQLLTELEYSNVPRSKEESAKLLSLLVAASRTLIKPYVDPMVSVLLPKARDANASVAGTIIQALGELSTVGEEEMRPYIPKLMPIIIEALQDHSSQSKREAALQALGQLAVSCGYVIDPYLEYPHLLTVLINIVKGETQGTLRTETIKLMGVLGALDPYKHQQVLETSPENQLASEAQKVTDVSLIMNGLTPSNEDYYPTVVINTLMNLLSDNTLSTYHSAVIDAVMSIFKTLGLKCVPFLQTIIPAFLRTIRASSSTRIESYFNQLSILVTIVRQHIRPFLTEILDTIIDYWNSSVHLQATILQLVEAVAKSLEGEFKVHLAQILPLMLGILESPGLKGPPERVLHALLVFGSNSEEYMHLIIPVIVRVFDNSQQPLPLRKQAIDTIGKLSRQVNLSDFASKIVHPLSRVLTTGDPSLRQPALDTLCALIFQLGRDYLHYVSMINKILVLNQISHTNYELLVSKLQRGEPLPQDLSPDERYQEHIDEAPFSDIGQKKLPVNQEHLKSAWETSQKSTKDDWYEWMRRFSVELLRESPSHALRACAGLGGLYQPLARELFNTAFISCYPELFPQYQDDLVRAIEVAITSNNIPPEILQQLLNLAEFMEHDEKALSIDIRTLGKFAGKCHAFAKALHYKELEFLQDTTSSSVEALISINNQLHQSDAAVGILRKAQLYQDVVLKETWFEKLQRWEEALQAYQRREQEDADSFDITMGKMRCLHALGEWEVLSTLAQEKWVSASLDHRRAIASLGAAAAWGLGQWDLMDIYLGVMRPNSPDRAFFGAISCLHHSRFPEAEMHIENARSGLDTELSALLGESYNRAYSVVVRVQMLAELEEIVIYKQADNQPQKQEMMRRTWQKRLKGCSSNVDVWQRMLKLRALVMSPKENMEMWIKFSNLCRKSNRIGLAEKSLSHLLDEGEELSTITVDSHAPPQVMYAHLKYLWSTGHDGDALDNLQQFTAQLSRDIRYQVEPGAVSGVAALPNGVKGIVPYHDSSITSPISYRDTPENRKLLCRCFLRQGEWQSNALKNEWQQDKVHGILASYAAATKYNNQSYKAWHAWALANFEVVTSLTSAADRETTAVPQSVLVDHVVPAIRGFFNSIALSTGSSLQDCLRLLTLWFAHGGSYEVNAAVTEGFSSVNVDTWLEVIPQLIARINQPNSRVRQSVHQVIAEVGRAHPQALVYPLTVALKSNVGRRSRSAGQIMDSFRTHSPKLVEQAELVSHELIRVAVLWHEQWHEALEEASRLYFGDHNIDGMFATLAPLYEQLDKGPETLREISFHQAFGRDLLDARDWCYSYRQSGELGELNSAWDLYYQVFKRIARQLPQILSLDLPYVSPRLEAAQDLDLAVPGTYHSGKPVVRIVKFDSNFAVINSKQRPRKISAKGSDGVKYTYLLKGHEDIRQDERVMQLFGLVNTLLATDSECFKRHLNIQRYPAIPLSQSSGLLGWVPNSDTFHILIREYRESHKILLNIEHRIMLQMAPDYDNLTLMQKVEVFGYALDNTTGQDLYRVLWLKSKSSESWLDRRTNYIRSLGVMSMVGYILGLGDRHPSNLMLDRVTGKVVHIDFGDCFEVAMHREKYPERVPFRLTRMLTYAMEVSNIEGSFRITCEAVMRVLRDNRESLMAVLEAFIHDPLLNWRLGNRDSPPEPSFPSERRLSIVGDMPAQRPRAESFRPRARSNLETEDEPREVQNARALQVLSRVKEKLTGHDFKPTEELNVPDQVEKLLQQATNLENLCQHYIGWCSFW